MAKPSEEWLTQANYDMDTAAYMFKGGGYMYTVFMCHLSIEKGLKGRYTEKLGKEPPKTHNLLYLIPGGHSKPASHGHLKTGHLDSSLVG